MNVENQKGYILVVTMLILAVSTIIVTSLIYRSNSAVPFVTSVIDRQKAAFLAKSGISYVQALVTFQPDVEQKDDEGKKSKEDTKEIDNEIKTIVARIFPFLNRWTELSLKEEIDGVDGKLFLYVSSEEGKININKAYDFFKKEFIGGNTTQADYIDNPKKLVISACQLLEKAYKISGLFEKLEKFLKNFDGPLNDTSDLLLVPGFEVFQGTVFPDFLHDTEKQLYLADIFTVFGNHSKLNPWFLSCSVKYLWGIKGNDQELANDTKKRDELVKQFSRNVSDWQKEWKKIGAQRYQKTVQQLPKGVISLFDVSCVPKIFTVVSVGQFKDTSYSLLALIEVIETQQNNQISYESRIKRWYVIE